MNEQPNTNEFQTNDETCNGCACSYLTRLTIALSYYNQASSSQAFIDFCDKYYSRQYLEDYIHFICIHKDDINAINMKNTICSNVDDCSPTQRHYRDRSNNNISRDDIMLQSIYFDVFDSIHFYIYHMEECGLRISITNNVNNTDDIKDLDDDTSDSNCRDEVIAEIQKTIEAKKHKCIFKRLNNSKNSKFTIAHINCDRYMYETNDKTQETITHESKHKAKKNSKSVWKKIQNAVTQYFDKTVTDQPKTLAEPSAETEEQKERTFTDNLLDNIRSIDENVVTRLKQYLLTEQYDTDDIQHDIDIYDEEKNCNLLEVTRNINCVKQIKKEMQNYIKMKNITTTAFSTGFVFWYWPYYKNVDDDQIKQQSDAYGFSRIHNDFGGHKVRELFVTKQFDSLQHEVLNSQFIGFKQFKHKVIKKGNAYFITKKCKTMKCVVKGDPLKFGIGYKDLLRKEHLYSLVLYCDFGDFSYAFSKTFRRVKWNEPLKSVRDRNGQYFEISKCLREVIQYYGIKEQGPFYSGLSTVLYIPEFCIRLNGPTSTTLHKEIAIRFATRDGMVIQLNNKYSPARLQLFFDVSWLSTYAEEEERIFIGGRYKMQLETIIIMENRSNYETFFNSFYKFDKVLSGDLMKGVNITKNDVDIVRYFTSYMLEQLENKNKFDSFITNTFYLFSQKRTQIVLNMKQISLVNNKDFVNLVMHQIKRTSYSVPLSNTNLFRSCLFRIFRNLKEIIIYSTYGSQIYSFNILKLLKMLEEVTLPKSFKTIIIKDGDAVNYPTGWLSSVHCKRVYKNFKIDSKRGGPNGVEHWMVISFD